MRFYNEISIFCNMERLRKLRAFRALIKNYLSDISYGSFGGGPVEGLIAQELRQEINRNMTSILSIVSYAVIPTKYDILRAPALGGGTYKVDVIANFFDLGQHDIDRSAVLDLLDRSIGRYEHDRRNAILRTINPFWWLWCIVGTIARLPFRALGYAGLNQSKIENSVIGKTFKLGIEIMIFAVAILQIDEYIFDSRLAHYVSSIIS